MAQVTFIVTSCSGSNPLVLRVSQPVGATPVFNTKWLTLQRGNSSVTSVIGTINPSLTSASLTLPPNDFDSLSSTVHSLLPGNYPQLTWTYGDAATGLHTALATHAAVGTDAAKHSYAVHGGWTMSGIITPQAFMASRLQIIEELAEIAIKELGGIGILSKQLMHANEHLGNIEVAIGRMPGGGGGGGGDSDPPPRGGAGDSDTPPLPPPPVARQALNVNLSEGAARRKGS